VRAACGDAPDDASVVEAVGAVDAAAVSRIGWALLRRDGGALLAEVEALYQRGQEMKRVAEEIVRHLRDVTVAKLVPSVPLDLPEVEMKEVRAQAGAADATQLARLFDIAQRAVAEVKLSEQPRYALEVALLKGALLAPGVEVSALAARLEDLAAGSLLASPGPVPSSGAGSARAAAPFGTPGCAAGSLPATSSRTATGNSTNVPTRPPTATSTPAAPPTPPPTATSTPTPTRAAIPTRDDPSAPLPDRWRAAVCEVEKVSPSTAPALKQGALLAMRDGEVALQFPTGSHYAAHAERKRAEVEGVFSRFFGRPTRLTLTAGPAAAAGGPSLAAEERAEREARAARLREAARSHPNIQDAAKALGAEIAKIEEL
jgi:DNA polymerase-3 subunit gamma/tau